MGTQADAKRAVAEGYAAGLAGSRVVKVQFFGADGLVAAECIGPRVAMYRAGPELLEALEGFVALVENDHILAAAGFRSYLIDALTKANEAVYKAKGEA